MKKNRKRKNRNKWSDRFKRVKNKNEMVYKVPDFFKRMAEISEITQSGICHRSNYGREYIKVYELQDIKSISDDEITEFCRILLSKHMYLQFISNSRNSERNLYFVVGNHCRNMEEAQDSFQWLEMHMQTLTGGELTNFQVMDGETHIKEFVEYMTEISSNTVQCINYMENTGEWKDTGDFEATVKYDEGYMQTKTGCFALAGIQKFPYVCTKNCLQKLSEETYVKAVLVDMECISDGIQRNLFENCYCGSDYLVSRMKRDNPVLHEVLQEKTDQDEFGHFMECTVIFWIEADTPEELKENISNLQKIGKEEHIKIRHIHFQNISMFNVFGLMGKRLDYSGQIMFLDDIKNVFPWNHLLEDTKEEIYDVEHLKKLFFEGENDETEE